MIDFGSLAGTGWAAGLNLWSATLVLGIAGRLGWADTPEAVQRTDVLIAAAVFYAAEFVVDKIPYVDNVWDVINTVIRPVGGALLGIAFASDGGESIIAGALAAGTMALTSHGAKATTRAAINMSPEPFSNIAASVTEDVASVGMVSLALAFPEAALVLAVILALVAVAITVTLWRFVRRLRNGWKKRAQGFAEST